MKKIINKIKEKDIDVILMLILIITPLTILVPVDSGDEIWNFSYIYKMSNGLLPYKDLNIIVTPLFHIIGVSFFKIFGKSLLSFKIYNIFICITTYFTIFKIFKNLNIKKKNSIIYLLLILLLTSRLVNGGANYNLLAIDFVLITVLLIVKNKQNYIVYGLLIFITVLIKQNIGLYLAIGLTGYILASKKNIVKKILKMYITLFISGIIFLFILNKIGILYDFYSYTFAGIIEFKNNNFALTIYTIIFLLEILICIFDIYIIKNKKINIDKNIRINLANIATITIPMLLVAYPIFNWSHIMYSSLIVFISFIYILDQNFLKDIIKKENFITLLLLILILVKIIETINGVSGTHIIKDKTNPYYGALISKENEENINKIVQYILQNKKNNIDTKILSFDAMCYTILTDDNNKNFDLQFLGNLGKNGEEGLIQEIQQSKNTKILIKTNEEDVFWQESKKVRKYIKDNYKKGGTIGDFDIYNIQK